MNIIYKVEDHLLCNKRNVRTQEVYDHWMAFELEERGHVQTHTVRL